MLFLGFFGDDWVALDLYGPGSWGPVVKQLAPGSGEFYRPLGFFLLHAELVLTSANPIVVHALHLGLFALAAWMTGRLAESVAGVPVGPWVAALALVYPGRIEVAMWMIAIFDLVVLILVLLGLLLFIERRERTVWPVIAVVAFMAPAAKEVGFVLPVIMTVWWAVGLVPDRRAGRRVLFAWGGAAAAVVLRLAAFGGVGGYTGVNVGEQALVRLSMVPRVALSALLAPVCLSFGIVSMVAALICAGAVIVAAVGAFRRPGRFAGLRLVMAGGSLFFLTLLPAVPFLNPNVVWFHSRLMGLPAVGVVLTVAGLLVRGEGVRRISFALVVGVWSLVTVFNLVPWFQGARAQEVILRGIESVTREPGPHTVWLDGPIGGFSGNHLLGGHLGTALKVRFPNRDIDSDSRFFQQLQGREQGPPRQWRGTLHVLRFSRRPPRLTEVPTNSTSR